MSTVLYHQCDGCKQRVGDGDPLIVVTVENARCSPDHQEWCHQCWGKALGAVTRGHLSSAVA